MPSPRKTDTRLVSTTSCTPPNKGNPPGMTPILLPRWFNTPKSRSLTRTLVLTRPPPSRQMRAGALSTAKPRRPNTPVVAHADRWWQERQRDGHTDTRVQTNEGKTTESNRVSRLVEMQTKSSTERGPSWESTIACSNSRTVEK